MTKSKLPLLVGEIFVDVTITTPGQDNKLRLGGIAHAARGLWALDTPFVTAAVLPPYLEPEARRYFSHLGCAEFLVAGWVHEAPNITLIFDPTETDDQGYETLLRDNKRVEMCSWESKRLAECSDLIVFPGDYDLRTVLHRVPNGTPMHIDPAYDVVDVAQLSALERPIETILLSTSSKLFETVGATSFEDMIDAFSPVCEGSIFLKENRGGARLHHYSNGRTDELPAHLGETVNSVGVGDVFDATYVALLESGATEAAWRATSAASAYSQTTYPDRFREYVQRSLKTDIATMQNLGGTILPWHDRQNYPIYLAAPDFSASDRGAIERAVSALRYHNFTVRRPVVENGELPPGSDEATLRSTYYKDVALLQYCSLLFAVPTGRDPGTLVEIGLAIQLGIPVVVYDPERECANTMVMAGADQYSANLDLCLNAVFRCLSSTREARNE